MRGLGAELGGIGGRRGDQLCRGNHLRDQAALERVGGGQVGIVEHQLRGGGAKAGHVVGATDEIGHKAVTDRVSINDLHATILHLLGIDHEKLTYRSNGRNFRLTDVAGRVVKEVVA